VDAIVESTYTIRTWLWGSKETHRWFSFCSPKLRVHHRDKRRAPLQQCVVSLCACTQSNSLIDKRNVLFETTKEEKLLGQSSLCPFGDLDIFWTARAHLYYSLAANGDKMEAEIAANLHSDHGSSRFLFIHVLRP
jgi:hypothetical protein